MNFGHALDALKDGARVARSSWTDREWLLLVEENEWSTSVGPSHVPNAHRLPWIGMKTTNGGFVPWTPNQIEMLEDDWCVVV